MKEKRGWQNRDQKSGVGANRSDHLGVAKTLGAGVMILSLILAAGEQLALATGRPDRPMRTVTVKIAAAEGLGVRPAWKRDIKRLIANCSETFKDEFGIEFQIVAWESWRPDKGLDSLPAFLEDLKKKVAGNEADITIGLAAPGNSDDTSAGIADYSSGHLLLRLTNPWDMAPILLHELGHVFGAVDLEQEGSVMDPRDPGLEFDRFSSRIINLNKYRSFHCASFPFPRTNLAEVISEFRARAELGRREPELRLFLAYFYIELGDYASAATEYEKLLEFSPGVVDAHVLLGNLRLAQGDVDGAIGTYQQILRSRRDLPIVHFNLGVAWMKKDMADRAASEFAEAIRLNPNYAEAHINLAHLCLRRGDLDSAIRHCRIAVNIYPDFPEGLCVLSVALILNESGDALREAAELSRKAIALKPQLPEAHAILALANMIMGRDEEAEAEFERTLELRRDSLASHLGLAILYKRTGKEGQAAYHLSQVGRIDPDFAAPGRVEPGLEELRQKCLNLLEKLR
jgi:tetratricopeptide (TPR) repeat protein